MSELRTIGFELEFPRLAKLHEPSSVNRPWARRLAALAARVPAAERLAESPLQSTIDVVARKPG
jgi:hypothetical protein